MEIKRTEVINIVIVVGAVVGLLIGGGGVYLLTTKQFDEKVASITQDANTKLAVANRKLTAANAQLATMNMQNQALAQPDPPVRVITRRALLGNRLVVQFRNYGATKLEVGVTAKSAASNQQGTWHLVLAPNQTRDIGHHQGWAFANGDEIELFESGYRPLKVLVQK